MDTLRIETAQHVAITYEVAGIGDRAIATIIDAFIQFIVLAFSWLILSHATAVSSIWVYFAPLLLVTLYHPICETLFDGQSIGKMQVGTRVARVDGGRPGVGAYILRWLIGLVELAMTSGIVALLAVLIGRRGQRLGDMAAGTAVIRINKQTSLGETGLIETRPTVEPHYPEVSALSATDIQTIRKVLHQTRANGRNARTTRLLSRTKEVVEEKMGLSPVAEQPYRFLLRVLEDYNAMRD